MKFSIIEHKYDSSEVNVKTVNHEEEFVDYVKMETKKYQKPLIKIMEQMTPNEIVSNVHFTNGFYLLINTFKIYFIEKYTNIEKGFIYNATYSDYIVHVSWKLILNLAEECETCVNSNINDSSSYNSNNSNDLNNFNVVNNFIDDDELTHTPQSVKIKVNNKNIQVKKFNIDNIPVNSHILLIGKRGSEKKSTIKNIISNFYKTSPTTENCIIIDPMEEEESFYKDHFPEAKIHYNFSEGRNDIESYISKFNKHGNNGNKKRGIIVLNDYISLCKEIRTDDLLARIMFNGRHYGLQFIMSVQVPLGISPELRANFDYVFLAKENLSTNKKRLYEQYAGMFPNFSSFNEVFQELTVNNAFMVVMNREGETELLDRFFYYKNES